MIVYAITYTDPGEPWGCAILDKTLYRSPIELVDAWNEHYERQMLAMLDRMRPDDRLLNTQGFDSVLEYITDDYLREFSVGIYKVA